MESVDPEFRPDTQGGFDITNNSGCLTSAVTHRPGPAYKNDTETHQVRQGSNLLNGRPIGKPRGRPFDPVQVWIKHADCATATIDEKTVTVDLADIHIVEGHRWFLLYRDNNVYASTGQGMLMHRMIAGCVKGDGVRVDHRDNNGLNNRRVNLRMATQSQNMMNRRKHKPTQSRFKGVWGSPCGKWRACIGRRGERIFLGLFDTEEEAAKAYDVKAAEHYGEFANPNFPLPHPTELKGAA